VNGVYAEAATLRGDRAFESSQLGLLDLRASDVFAIPSEEK
jgi:hypothetical protein